MTATISPRIIDEMRDVLIEMGFDGARFASDEKIVAKIERFWKNGVEGYLKFYSHN